MTATGVRLEGQRELRAALRRTGNDMADLRDAHADAAKVVERRAVVIVPRRSGTLASTIRSSGTKTRGTVRAGFARVPYAGPIHFGSPKGWPVFYADGIGKLYGIGTLNPQPFIYDAMDQRRDEVIDVYAERLVDTLRRNGLDPHTTIGQAVL